jgi:cobalamin synthase
MAKYEKLNLLAFTIAYILGIVFTILNFPWYLVFLPVLVAVVFVVRIDRKHKNDEKRVRPVATKFYQKWWFWLIICMILDYLLLKFGVERYNTMISMGIYWIIYSYLNTKFDNSKKEVSRENEISQ